MNFSWAQVIAKLLTRHNNSRIVDREAEVTRKFPKPAQAMHVSQPDQPHCNSKPQWDCIIGWGGRISSESSIFFNLVMPKRMGLESSLLTPLFSL